MQPINFELATKNFSVLSLEYSLPEVSYPTCQNCQFWTVPTFGQVLNYTISFGANKCHSNTWRVVGEKSNSQWPMFSDQVFKNWRHFLKSDCLEHSKSLPTAQRKTRNRKERKGQWENKLNWAVEKKKESDIRRNVSCSSSEFLTISLVKKTILL